MHVLLGMEMFGEDVRENLGVNARDMYNVTRTLRRWKLVDQAKRWTRKIRL